jgi:hypothetical protein
MMNEETSAGDRNRSPAVSSFFIPPASFETKPGRAGPFVKTNKSKCPEMLALTFPPDRQGTLYVCGVKHSTGLFHTHLCSGLYVQSLWHTPIIPKGTAIVLLADDGERFAVERIYPCPSGEAHHHFEINAA